MIILGLGTNVGDRVRALKNAIHALARTCESGVRVRAISPLYESDAMLLEGAPESWNEPFLNLAVAVESELSPAELLKLVKAIEHRLGRQPRGRWAPREIDIDVLAMDHQVYQDGAITIPHAGLLERPFALLPLVDLAPGWAHPLTGARARDLCAPWLRAPESAPFRTRRARQRLTETVGILNVTPDSFSDGGSFAGERAALEQARALVAAGAAVIDIGAESTRPGATLISAEDEWKRLAPVLEGLAAGGGARFSVDTRHAETAARALRAGACWINDVTGFEDPAMIGAVADSPVDLVVMHSLSVPPRKDQILSEDRDPIDQLLEWGEAKLGALERAGIDRSRVILDPGIGFGKSPAQAAQILREAHRLGDLGARILIGHSRKSFLSELSRRPAAERDPETLALSLGLARQGIDYLRVHAVELSERALDAQHFIDGVIRWPA